jgi:hypothetical protein
MNPLDRLVQIISDSGKLIFEPDCQLKKLICAFVPVEYNKWAVE